MSVPAQANRTVAALKSQIVVAFIAGGAVIVAAPIFIFSLIRLVRVLGIGAELARPVSKKLDAWRRGIPEYGDGQP